MNAVLYSLASTKLVERSACIINERSSNNFNRKQIEKMTIYVTAFPLLISEVFKVRLVYFYGNISSADNEAVKGSGLTQLIVARALE